MASIISKKYHVYVAEQFKEAVSESAGNTALYLAYGKAGSWADENAPDAPNMSVLSEYSIWKEMIGAKRITGNDIAHVVPRYDWTANTKYIAYDETLADLYGDNVKFYVMTSTYGVYKCLGNNASANSTVMPTSTSANTVSATSDGYLWKYMYTISDADRLRYMTPTHIPVKTLPSDDGSLQWQVQSGAINGTIDAIRVTSGGSGYTNVANLSVIITGDGVGCAAIATLNTLSNTVSSITVTNPGANYTNAVIILSGGGGAGATAKAVIPPYGGHGSNPLYELGGSTLVINTKLNAAEGGTLPTTNEYRQIALIKDPMTKSGAVASNSVFLQAYTITTAGSGTFIADEYVYQGTSLSASTFKGRVVSFANTDVILTDTIGTPTTATLIGANSATARLVTSVHEGDLASYTGQILYVNNFKPISRSSDQSENFQIVFKL